jgi:serine/threonine protein kinase
MNTNSVWRVLSGKIVNNQYVLKNLLGVGGFGAVFLADEVVGNRLIRQVAIKMVVSDATSSQLNELVTATKVQHPNLLRYITGGECHLMGTDFRYLLMELADTSLEKELQKRKLSDSEVSSLVRDIAAGLAYLHQRSIVHRDLKPGNILRIGSTWKIADFGLVKEIGKRTHVTNNLIGTPIYMSPDALRGKVNSAWDMWSLGVLILEVLTGKFPYKIENRTPEELVGDILHKEPNIPTLKSPWNRIIKGCLTKDYKTRWRATQVIASLTPKASLSLPFKSALIWGGVAASAIASINLVFQPSPFGGDTLRTTATTRSNPSVVKRCNAEANDLFYRNFLHTNELKHTQSFISR